MAHPAYGRLEAYPLAPKTTHMATEAELVQYIDLKLAALGHPTARLADGDFLAIARPLLRNIHQKDLMLGNLLCPADRRIQNFLDIYLKRCVPGRRRATAGEYFRARSGRAGAHDVAAAARRHVSLPRI